jgi:hypothetical protein
MTLTKEYGTFTKTTSTSTPVSQQVNLNDSSLTPKLIILWTSGQTTTDGTYADHMLWSYGWSDTTNDCCQAMRSHETNENEAYVMRNDAIISILSLTAGSEVSRADVSSVAAGSFTLNWSTQSDTTAMVIHYIVVGGTDITNVSAFTTTMTNTSTGNHSWNPGGTTFTPDFALTMAMQDVTALAINTISAGNDLGQLSIGAATGTSNQWLLAAREETATTSDNDMYLHTGQCLGSLNPSSGAFAYGGAFVSFDNSAGGGITVNITTAASNVNPIGFLFVKGGKWDVQGFQQRSGTGTQNVTLTDSTVIPKIVSLFGINDATANTVVVNHYVGIGASDGTREGNSWNGSTNALGTWVTARSTSNSKVYRNATPAATATSSTTNAECDMTDMSTAGQFTLDWTTADSTQRRMAFWMVGEVSSGTTYNRSPTAEDVTVSDSSITRILSAARAPSSDSTTVSDSSLTRTLQAFRSPSTDTVDTTEDVQRSKTWPRQPTDETVVIEDVSTTQMITRVRAPSTEDITIDDSGLTRMLQAFRSPSTDNVTAEDSSTTQIITRVRAPGADDITVSDVSVTRLLQLFRSPSSDSIVIDDTGLTRTLSASRSPSSDSTTVSDASLTRILSLVRSPTSDSITAEDSSTTQMITRVRVPSAENVALDENLTRMLQLFRSPSSDIIDVSEQVTGGKLFERLPSTDTVTVADSSLTRLLSALRISSSDSVIIGEDLTRILSAIRSPSSESVTTSEDVDRTITTAGQFDRAPNPETVTISDASLTRILSAIRLPSTDSINLNEQLTRILSASRSPSSDSTVISEQAPNRIVSRIRSLSETPDVVESSLTRVLTAFRSIEDTTIVSELQSQISHSRLLEETVSVTEPVIERIVTAIRAVTPETVIIDEQVFFQALHKFVFDSVAVAESLFSIRQALSGSVTYATPAEVRPLLGNLGQQRTDAQIQLAIDSAYDEINRKTNRQPPNDWKDTENDFGIVKKICRFKAALEMAVGIKDFEDREWMQKEIEEMFTIIEEHDPGGVTSNDLVGSSADETYALNEVGIIWSTRYKNLRKNPSSGGENSTTINPDT